MGEHELLIRHLTSWCRDAHVRIDPQIVGHVLAQRDRMGERAYGSWPAGSARRLMQSEWPDRPEHSAVAQALEGYWQFLRETGRMDDESGDQATLYAELSQCVRAGQRVTDETAAHPSAASRPRQRRPPRRRGRFPDQRSIEVSRERGTPFVAELLGFAAWVGDGKEVTNTKVLRPAVARSAYRELDLWSWERDDLQLEFGAVGITAEATVPDTVQKERMLRSWRSAADCRPLERLWSPCVTTGIVTVGSRWAVSSWQPPATPKSWFNLSLAAALAFAQTIRQPSPDIVVEALTEYCETRAQQEEMARRARWVAEHTGRFDASEHKMTWLELALFHFCGCGLWDITDGRFMPTALGRDFAERRGPSRRRRRQGGAYLT